ncbi:MAG: PqiC family protein [Desulfobacterales bacterium]|jgi:uncharacterized lipoprotein YmbA
MTRAFLACRTIWLAWLIALILIGCRSSSPPVQFYTLSAIRSQAAADTHTNAKSISVGVGPVVIPDVLDRPQIVTRTSPHELHIDEYHRWAGPLGQDFARVVAENISLMLPAEQVTVYPWDTGFQPNYQVTLNIRHFEGRKGQDVLLEVFWTVIDLQKGTTLRVKKSVITEPLPDETYEGLIISQNKAIASLSSIITKELNRLN